LGYRDWVDAMEVFYVAVAICCKFVGVVESIGNFVVVKSSVFFMVYYPVDRVLGEVLCDIMWWSVMDWMWKEDWM
jgi:hypothetical protein